MNNMSSIKPRICFITSLIGDSYKSSDKPPKFEKFGGHTFYLFTNLPQEEFSTGWDVISISDDFLDAQIKNVQGIRNVYKSRYIKFMGWKYIQEEMNEFYDIIFYCDAHHIPRENYEFEQTAQAVIEDDFGLVQNKHQWSVQEELVQIVKQKKDTKENMQKMKDFLFENNVPNIQMRANLAFGYHPANPKIISVMNDFWYYYISENISHRDQPMWAFICWKHNVEGILLPKGGVSAKMFSGCNGKESVGFNKHTYV